MTSVEQLVAFGATHVGTFALNVTIHVVIYTPTEEVGIHHYLCIRIMLINLTF